jgi:hypothetical protein
MLNYRVTQVCKRNFQLNNPITLVESIIKMHKLETQDMMDRLYQHLNSPGSGDTSTPLTDTSAPLTDASTPLTDTSTPLTVLKCVKAALLSWGQKEGDVSKLNSTFIFKFFASV